MGRWAGVAVHLKVNRSTMLNVRKCHVKNDGAHCAHIYEGAVAIFRKPSLMVIPRCASVPQSPIIPYPENRLEMDKFRQG